MTIGGWIFMLVSLTFVWSLVGWCYYRVLTAPAAGQTPAQTPGQPDQPGPGTAGRDPGAPPR